MELREDHPEVVTDGVLKDVFEGYFPPEDFLSPEEANKVNEAISIVDDYVDELKEVAEYI